MEYLKAEFLFCESFKYVADSRPDELSWAYNCSSNKFRAISSRTFLSEYTWVVYAAGFNVKKIEKIFPALKKAFYNFDIEKMACIKSIKNVLRVFNNPDKANWVIRGAKLIKDMGFNFFKEKISQNGIDYLERLPGIGQITKDHLARNIGYASVPKNDIWIMRLTKILKADSHTQLVDYLSNQFNENAGVIDAVLWRFCRDNAWKSENHRTLDDYLYSLA